MRVPTSAEGYRRAPYSSQGRVAVNRRKRLERLARLRIMVPGRYWAPTKITGTVTVTIELDPKPLTADQIWNSPQLAVIVPSYKERDNIAPLYDKVTAALGDIPFEFIVVDDISPDGTAAVGKDMARRHSNVRCIHRIGRRGLSSAVIEGISASAAPYFAVIDADHQHDERILPLMLDKALGGDHIVVGTR